MRGRQLVVVVVDVVAGEAHLLEVVGGLHASGGLADLLNGWEQETDEDRDDGDHYQQLNEREGATTRHVRMGKHRRDTQRRERQGHEPSAKWAERVNCFIGNGKRGSGKSIRPLCRILTDSSRPSPIVPAKSAGSTSSTASSRTSCRLIRLGRAKLGCFPAPSPASRFRRDGDAIWSASSPS